MLPIKNYVIVMVIWGAKNDIYSMVLGINTDISFIIDVIKLL